MILNVVVAIKNIPITIHSNWKMTSQLRICIIGAGAAGICAAKHLSKLTPALKSLEHGHSMPKFIPMVFEKGGCVGGTWLYNDKSETEKSLKEWIAWMDWINLMDCFYSHLLQWNFGENFWTLFLTIKGSSRKKASGNIFSLLL